MNNVEIIEMDPDKFPHQPYQFQIFVQSSDIRTSRFTTFIILTV